MKVLQNNVVGTFSQVTPSYDFKKHYNKCSRTNSNAYVSVSAAKANTRYTLSYKIRFLTNARQVDHVADSDISIRAIKIDGEVKSITSMEWFDTPVPEAKLNTWYTIEIGFDSTSTSANLRIIPNSGVTGLTEFELLDLMVSEGSEVSDVWLPPHAQLSVSEQSYIPAELYGDGWGEASAF